MLGLSFTIACDNSSSPAQLILPPSCFPSSNLLVYLNGLSCTEGLIGSQDDTQTVDSIVSMVGQVAIVTDRLQEKFLLQAAEGIVIGLVGGVDPLVIAREVPLAVQPAMVQA